MPSWIPELGEVLRRWRVDVAAMKATEAAAALGVGRSAISNWESGRRQPGPALIERLDRAYGAGGALADVAFALETPDALAPRPVWWHNCPPGGAPTWAWVRPHPGAEAPTATAFWGAFRCDAPGPLAPVGVVLAVASSVPNPPIKVVVGPTGWADFGRGVFPEALGVPVISVVDHASLADLPTNMRAVLPRRSRRDLGRAQRRLVRAIHELLGEPMDAAEAAIEVLEHDSVEFDDLSAETPGPPPRPALRMSGGRYAATRRHRRMSRAEAAAAASALLPAHPVTEDHLEVLEGGGRPRVERLGSRLDTVYRGDGHTFVETVAVTADPAGGLAVEFPRYWVGPVWLTLLAPAGGGTGAATLEWAPWKKHLCARAGLTVSFRRPTTDQPPLRLTLQPGWSVVAGIGHVESATDLNDGWQTIDEARAREVFPHLYSTYLKAFGVTHREFVGLLRSIGGPDPTDAF